MKYFLLLIFFVLSCAGYAQDSTVAINPDIFLINAKAELIDSKLSGYKLKQKDIEGLSTEGGVIKAYYDKKEIKKITVVLYGETGFSAEDFYYENYKLIYVFSRLSLYDKPFGEVSSESTNKYYFSKQKLIIWLNDAGQPVKKEKGVYEDAQKLMLYNSQNFVNFMKK